MGRGRRPCPARASAGRRGQRRGDDRRLRPAQGARRAGGLGGMHRRELPGGEASSRQERAERRPRRRAHRHPACRFRVLPRGRRGAESRRHLFAADRSARRGRCGASRSYWPTAGLSLLPGAALPSSAFLGLREFCPISPPVGGNLGLPAWLRVPTDGGFQQ